MMIPEEKKDEVIYRGLPVSGGIVRAVIHVLRDQFDEPDEERIQEDGVAIELARFNQALDITRKELSDLQDSLRDSKGSEEADIFDAHLLILDDPSIMREVDKMVRKELICVDAVYYRLMCKHMDALRGLSDSYLRERFLDIKDITQRVMRHLRGEMLTRPMFDEPVIIVAQDLTPSDTVQMDRSKVMGFATQSGSVNSHAAIIARSLMAPAVVRLNNICDEVHSGDLAILDGDEGLLIVNPTQERIEKYQRQEVKDKTEEELWMKSRFEDSKTTDGQVIEVAANGEFVEELAGIADSGAREIGLFRTEFLHLANPESTEDWLAENYIKVVRTMKQELVVFRTLDLGGDKVDESLVLEPEPNPFLGWRGIRISFGCMGLFKKQLRALLRASAFGNVGIMFPMITSVEEVVEAKKILATCREELLKEGKKIGVGVKVGAMIEVPSAALLADRIARQVDFMSLGTNDLTQYTLAVDRLNDRVSSLYQTTHPAVLSLIQVTVEAGRKHGARVAICGEMAADEGLTPLLIGLGLDELSVAAGQVARIKYAVRKLNAQECRHFAEEVMKLEGANEIREACLTFSRKNYAELMG
jgi:phosphotransferase system enzyme I (PtsI)